MKKQYKYSVYIHTNKKNGKVYIGVTHQDPETRWANGHGYRTALRFGNAIKKYGWDCFTHEVVISDLSEENAYQWEIALIALYDSTNRKKGYNMAPGGKGGPGKHSKETRERLSQIGHTKTGSLNSFYGRKHTEAARAKMRDAKRRNPNTYANALHGGMATKKIVDKPVLQYTLDGAFVARHPSMTDASLSICGKKDNHIGAVCAGKRKSAMGYLWRFEEAAL